MCRSAAIPRAFIDISCGTVLVLRWRSSWWCGACFVVRFVRCWLPVAVWWPCGQVSIRFKGCGPGRGKSSRDAKRLETWLQGGSQRLDQRSPGMTSSDWSEKPCSVDSR